MKKLENKEVKYDGEYYFRGNDYGTKNDDGTGIYTNASDEYRV